MKKLVVAWSGALAFSFFANRASAQVAVEWQGAVTAGIGVTTNVANTPVPEEGAGDDTPTPEWDGYGIVTPGIQLSLETPRTTHTFSYVFDYHFYFVQNEANAISNSVGYGLAATLSPTATFTFGLTGGETQASAFNLVGRNNQPQLAATNGGNNYLFTGVANQSLTVAVSELDTFSQGLAFTASDTLPVVPPHVRRPPQTQTYIFSGTLGLSHEFKQDRLGGSVGTDATLFSDQTTGADITPSHIDMVHRATLDWHHDFSLDWSSSLSAGPMVVYQVDKVRRTLTVQPTGTASIDYANERGTAGLAYAHAAQANLVQQQMAFVDTVTLSGALPLWGTNFDISGAAALLSSRNLLADQGGFSGVTYGALIDAAGGWQKPTLPIRLELRYQLSRQFGIGKVPEGQPEIPDIRRQNLQFSITYYFPHPPAIGQHGPSLVAIPSPGSNPDILSRQTETRGQMDDRDRGEMHERREKRGKEGGGEGSSGGGGDSGGGGESKGGTP